MTPIYILGNEKRLRRETIDSLHLRAGQTVLDIACGAGRNFPLILEKIGPSGKLVGVDYTSAMLTKARERVKREGWQNVELIRSDAALIDLERKFDAAVCTLAMGVILDYHGALDRMVGWESHLRKKRKQAQISFGGTCSESFLSDEMCSLVAVTSKGNG